MQTILERPLVITDWMSAYQSWLDERYTSPQTIRAYLQDLRSFAAWFAIENRQELTPDLVTRIDLRAYRTYSLQQERVAGATWNRRRSSLGVLCEWARQAGHIPHNPITEIKSVKTQRSAPRWLSRPDLNRFLRFVELQVNGARSDTERTQALRDQAMIYLMLYAGLREGEVAALDLRDVRISERSGRIRILGKGDKLRDVPLNAEVRRAMTMWIEVGCAGGPLFTNRTGQRVSTRLIQRRVAEIGAQAGVNVTPHQLRHTFAKRVLDAGRPISEVQNLLGHERIETTARYVRPGWEDLEQAVESW